MSGLQRAMRHPDRRSDAHARARALVSDRFIGSLSGADAAWLRDHLDSCAPCRRMADSFAADRARVHALREEIPMPPRDLGARLSRALDVEVRRAVREDTRRGRRSRLWSPSFALAGIAVAAALAVVVLPLLVARLGLGIGPAPLIPDGNGGPAATPMFIATQTVAWVQRAADGTYILTSAPVDRVCPGTDASACGTLDGSAQALVTLTVQPSAVLLQHNGTSAVLVGRNALYAFSVPRDASVTPTVFPSSPIPTPGALSPTPAVTGVGATPPAATPVPTGSKSPRPTRTAPSASPSPARSPASAATSAAVSASPSQSPAESPAAAETPLSSGLPTPAASLVSIPPASPAPSAAATTPIIEGVVLVGGSPAYSADGQWVAFSARPADGSLGPDIYVWRVGDAKARALTTDHASVFSSWDLNQIVGSAVLPAGSTVGLLSAVTIVEIPSPGPASPAIASGEPGVSPEPSALSSPTVSPPSASPVASRGPSPSPARGAPAAGSPLASPSEVPAPAASASPEPSPVLPSVPVESFLLDPAAGTRTSIPRPAIWRPVVDPTNRVAVFWMGDQALDPATNTWIPTNGRLVIADWQALLGAGDVTATPLPGSAGLMGVSGWDVQWDPSGRHLAVWIADPADPSIGRLNLFAVNPDGSMGETLLADVSSLPALSLGADRLAWASPPGQNGQGSTISVFAWSADGAGSLHGAPDPGSDPIVIAR